MCIRDRYSGGPMPEPVGVACQNSNSVGGTTSALSRRAGDPRHAVRLRRSPELLGAHAELLFDLAAVAIDRLQGDRSGCVLEDPALDLSLIHISEPTRLGMISYAVFCLK